MEQLAQNIHRIQSDLASDGVDEYLKKQQQKGLLRFLTCGSVDDGKSTLIGRLLHDSAQIYEDQLANLKADSAKVGTTGDTIDLALLVDGLQAEREQGITIDVAYRYFSSEKRKFIIADTPGHEQYTRNMATGASTCDLAVILIDARYGVQTQTRRHAFIAALLGIKHFIVAINKMDLLDFDEQVFKNICASFEALKVELPAEADLNLHYVPLSALNGDNVVSASKQTPWYQGKTLLSLLETIDAQRQLTQLPFRFPVQYVCRPNLNFRGFAGTIASGQVEAGQEITVLPSGKKSKIDRIVTFDGDKKSAFAGEAITLTLEDEIDISRGDLLSLSDAQPLTANNLVANIVWMSESPLVLEQCYDLKIAGKKTQAKIVDIEYLVDVNSYQKNTDPNVSLTLNSIARVKLELTETIAVDLYKVSRETGSFIVIDRLTNATVAAAMVVFGSVIQKHNPVFTEQEIELNAYIRKHYPHWQALDISQLNKAD